MRTRFLVFLLLLVALVAVTACSDEDEANPPTTTAMSSEPADGADEYFCPMHPEIRSAAEGRCPKCSMFLVKEGEEHLHEGAASEGTDHHSGRSETPPTGGHAHRDGGDAHGHDGDGAEDSKPSGH